MFNWFKKKKDQVKKPAYQVDVENDWRGKFAYQPRKAEVVYNHYHMSGFPINFPWWLSRHEYGELVMDNEEAS